MRTSLLPVAAAAAAFVCAPATALLSAAPATAALGVTFAYTSTVTTPDGNKSVNCTIALAPSNGHLATTIAMPGKPPVTIQLPSGGGSPASAPQGGNAQQQAQLRLILERVAIAVQIRKDKAANKPLAVKIPVLPPGATQPLQLPATLSAQGQTLTGSTSTQTSAEVDTKKAQVHGLLPIRRVAQRLKNAVTPATVTLPDSVQASLAASLSGAALSGLSGTVTHTLSGHGKTVVITENWKLTKT